MTLYPDLGISPVNNCFYFYDNLDVRVALKCGYTYFVGIAGHMINQNRISEIMYNLDRIENLKNNSQIGGSSLTRTRRCLVRYFADIYDVPFRHNTTRIAISRDPLKRFMSALEWMYTRNLDHNFKDYPLRIKRKIDWRSMSLDEAIDGVTSHKLEDLHFAPQYWFYGSKTQYDKIYDISELNLLGEYILSRVDNHGYDVNKKTNETRIKHFPKAEDLSESQKQKIYKFYEIDYKEGWGVR